MLLSVEGEKKALELCNIKELHNINNVYSSNSPRTIQTAKYFSNEIYIDESFNERKFGINSWEELPKDFEKKQLEDFNYKTDKGESINEVIKKQYNSLINILNNKDKKMLIVTLLSK